MKGHETSIQSDIAGCNMPPSGEARPSDAERETLLTWIVCGATDS
jgi:hypothetical protein